MQGAGMILLLARSGGHRPWLLLPKEGPDLQVVLEQLLKGPVGGLVVV